MNFSVIYIFAFILVNFVGMTENKEYIEFPSEKIIKSQQDDREYKLITLKNELDVLLISDVIYILILKFFYIIIYSIEKMFCILFCYDYY